MNFLFRRESGLFISAANVEEAYEYTCANCGYPVGEDDAACPRCMRKLEACPTCTHRTKKLQANRSGAGPRRCPVCDVQRVPFGQKLDEIDGCYCTNIYGCAAGGLLLKSGEFAVLRPGASVCSVCRNKNLLPLSVRTFRHVISSCCFCNTIFGSMPSWYPDADKDWSNSMHRLIPVRQRREGACALCGRNDYVNAEEAGHRGTVYGGDDYNLPQGAYLRVLEFARALILYEDMSKVFDSLFRTWFQPEPCQHTNGSSVTSGDGRDSNESIPVRKIMQVLTEGTLRMEVFTVLAQRVDEFGQRWKKHGMPEGINFDVPIVEPASRRAQARGAG